MCGEDAQARIVERAQERERVSLRRAGWDALVLPEIVQGRLVAVVPVGDIHARALQRRGDATDSFGVVDSLEAVSLRADRGLTRGRARGLSEGAHQAGGVSEHCEHGAGVRARRTQELEPVGFRFGKGELVWQHDAVALRIQTQRSEDPPPYQTPARDLEPVLVEIEGRMVLTTKPPLGDPVGQVLCGLRVSVLWTIFGKLDA